MMRRIASTALIGLVFPLAGTAWAKDDEPPIVERDFGGETVRTQTWATGRQDVAVMSFGSQAARYYAWRALPDGAGGMLRAQIECAVSADGTVFEYLCEVSCPDFPELNCRRLTGLVGSSAFVWPQLKQVSERQAEQVQRYVTAEFEIDTSQRVDVDFESGEELPLEEVLEVPLSPAPDIYPRRALRQEAEGVLVINCKVLEDRSVACIDQDFTPPENRALFVETVPRMSRLMRAKPALAGGGSVIGKRFLYRVNFMIPD